MKTIPGWLREPVAAIGHADTEEIDPLACDEERVTIGRPLFRRMAAPPSLVSRLVRKSIGWTTTSSPAPLAHGSIGGPSAVALALTLAEEP